MAVRNFSRASFSLFEAPGEVAYSRLKDIQDYWEIRDHSQVDLIEAGRDAQRHANAADLQLQQAATLEDDNQRLADLLQLPAEPGFHYEYARVIRRDETTWWQQLVIRKGRLAGLEPGQGVVFAGGWDRVFRALDAASGKELWRVRANNVINGGPISYSVNGRQYIAVTVGNGSGLGQMLATLVPKMAVPDGGSALWVFALPEPTPR